MIQAYMVHHSTQMHRPPHRLLNLLRKNHKNTKKGKKTNIREQWRREPSLWHRQMCNRCHEYRSQAAVKNRIFVSNAAGVYKSQTLWVHKSRGLVSYEFSSRIIKNLSRELDTHENTATLLDGRWQFVPSGVQEPEDDGLSGLQHLAMPTLSKSYLKSGERSETPARALFSREVIFGLADYEKCRCYNSKAYFFFLLSSQDFPLLNEIMCMLGYSAVTFRYEECRFTTGPSTWRTARFASTLHLRDDTPVLSASGWTTLGRAAPTTTSLALPLTMYR